VTGVLSQPDTLDMTSTEIGLIASVYLYFGKKSDAFGIKAEGKSLESITKPITSVDTPVTVAAET